MIKIFDGGAEDFSGQGLGFIYPVMAEVHGVAGGEFEIDLELPIDDSRDDWVIGHQKIISAPAPVRTSPEVNFGISGGITRYIVKATSKVKMYNLKNRKKVLKSYKKGTKFIRLEVDGNWYKVSTVKGGSVGWMKSARLDFDSTVDDVVNNDVSTVVEEVVCKDQLFRIYNIVRDVANLRVKVRAEHITYDLKGVIVDGEYSPEDVPADEVLAQILAKADQQDLPFNIYCGCTDLISGDYTGRNLIDCILNGDDGIAVQCNARVIRDNYSIYILPPEDRYLGVDIRYGDNLIKANAETDSGSTITRIKPVGKNKNGKPLYITENNGFVDSPYASGFAVERTKRIEYNNVQTGKGGLGTDKKARERLKELALKEFEKSGIIAHKIDAKFVRRELTEEYKTIANEAALHLYDIAKIKAARAGVVASVRMTEYVFDALPGRERYIDTKISDIVESEPMVYGVNIANNSVSGTKITNNTLSGDKIRELSIGIGKFDVATIDQLNANSITAITAHIQQIVSEKITTDSLYAATAEMLALKVGMLTASDITTDRLAAAIANFTVLTAGTATFDQATIQHLVSNALNLKYGVGGDVFIENLRVVFGQMVQATIGDLCIKASDNKYYNIDVDSNGNVTATLVPDPTDGEISAGQTSGGRVILETHITAESLNTSNLLATYALINKIDAAKIDVSELFANTAFVGALTTNKIIGDKSITIMARDIAANEEAISAQNKSLADSVTKLNEDIASIQTQVDGGITSWYMEGEPTAANEPAVNWNTEALREEHQGDLYYDKLTGRSYRWMKDGSTWKWVPIVDSSVSEALDKASKAQDTADKKKRIFYEQPKPPYDVGDLWVQGAGGDIYVCTTPKLAEFAYAASDWKIASKYTDDTKANAAQNTANEAKTAAGNAQAAANAAQSAADNAQSDADTAGEVAQRAVDAIGDIPQRVEVMPDGTYFKDEDNASVLKITSGSVAIGTVIGEGKGYSQFAANYVQFGKYQMRRTADGGMAFKLTEVI